MSPTIFSASKAKQESRRQELEEELRKLQEEANHSEELSSLPDQPSVQPQPEPQFQSEPPSEPQPQLQPDPVIPDATPPAEIAAPTVAAEVPSPEGEKVVTREPEDYSEIMRQEKPTTDPLASFVIRPPGAKFINQHSKEKILLVLRQHPIVNVKWILITIILLLAPFLIFPLLPIFSFVPGRFQFFAMIGWYLLVSAYVIESFLYWYYNIYIITDERIVDIDFISLIYRQVSEAKIDKVEDVTASTAGVFAGVFNYGNVNIQTAAEKREFEFLSVPQPAKVTKLLNELILEEERERIEGRVM
jgi:hypothetical protein